MKTFRRSRLLLSSLALLLLSLPGRAADTAAWIEKSNANAQVLLDITAKLSPEYAGRIGVTGLDDKIADLTPGFEERADALRLAARDTLEKRRLAETDPQVRQDLEIMVQAVDRQLNSSALSRRMVLPYRNVPQMIFFGEFNLLDDQIDAARRPAALARLRRYVGLEPGTKSAVQLTREHYEERAANPDLLPPYRGEVEDHLASIPRYAAGIRQLYAKYGIDKLDGAAAALDAMDAQFKAYAEWVRTVVLPKARTDARLPAELYADNLKSIGLDIPPQELMARAKLAFTEIRNEMKVLAPLVAKEHGWADTDYRAVIRALKQQQIAKEDVEPLYHGIITAIEDIIRREHIVSLPDRPMRMRIASEAENASQPAPHYQSPPLINSKGEQGVFVLTTGNANNGGPKVSFDDFTYKAGAWTLTAHEGRPGHDLQYAAMVERGVSLARSLYAFNSVNAEGWALYAEAETKPYLPLDGQLIALQHRLMRSARAFLDPMLNLGLTTRERALEILTQDVCLSQAMANQEVDRYTFRLPGQATAYFYGYIRLMELRTTTEIALGPKFDRLAFNDFVISQGLLPPALLAKAVNETFIPEQLKK